MMNAKRSTELLPWLLALNLMACTQIGKAQVAPPITILHSFNGNDGRVSEAYTPWSGYDVFGAGLIQGRDGALYGTTLSGGVHNNGTVFKITTGGAFTSLYSFAGASDGDAPTGVIQGRDGAFYGTTLDGGPFPFNGGLGTVFKITPSGALTILHNFLDFGVGEWPYAGLVQGKDGALYGTTAFGGSGDYGGPIGDGVGTVFKIRPDSSGFTTLYNFTGGADGVNPWSALTLGKDGALYGTNYGYAVDANLNEYIVGSVFKITDAGALTVLHDFGSNDGIWPYGALVQGKDGAFYGTTQSGGANNNGTVFKITPSGTLTTLYSFSASGSADGALPYAGLIWGKDGALYGTAANGGVNGYGTVFRITTAGMLTMLHSFSDDSGGGNADGAEPSAPLLQGKDGNLYGVASYGGPGDDGTVFKLTMTPVITRFSPTKGPAGTIVTLTGANFTEAINVQFGNIYVGFKINSDTSLTLTVPQGATSSKITVYNPFGKGASKTAFKIIP